jgi:hypothetical protein
MTKLSERRRAQGVALGLTLAATLALVGSPNAFVTGAVPLGQDTGAIQFEGFSSPEAFGRWTDGPSAKITFDRPLPRAFTLTLNGHAFADNAGRAIEVRVGGRKRAELEATNENLDYSLSIDNPELASDIEFLIPHPASPKSLGEGDDTRLLGFAFYRLEVDR